MSEHGGKPEQFKVNKKTYFLENDILLKDVAQFTQSHERSFMGNKQSLLKSTTISSVQCKN
tara:strand:+ start:435 stop:617 length:183 start_codon:yes stop_codon:yes gene_type:complete